MPLRKDVFRALLLTVCLTAMPAVAAAVDAAKGPPVAEHDIERPSAMVKVDGRSLFRVRGITALPAEERATGIRERIEAAAADPSLDLSDLRAVDTGSYTDILARDQRVLAVTDPDARLEGLDRKDLALVYVARIGQAIEDYRTARTREALTASGTRAAVATAVLLAVLVLMVWLWRRMRAALEARYRQRIHTVGIQSFQIVRAERIWGSLERLLSAARVIAILVAAFLYLEYVLTLFPWTREAGERLSGYVLEPLAYLGRGLLGIIPNLIFLAILVVVVRYLLKIVHLFFAAVGRGEVRLTGFEAEWAEPTYKLLRLLAVVLTLVVAYPYIPGSGTEAFKGLSIFIGIVFSLGASSTIANMVAGYMMTYRRAFRVGDRVKIQDIVGDVTEMRLQVTHVRTIKNEEVIIPNSTILSNEVVNYSTLSHKEGLILHTTVGIGYETPWRQVEAMLTLAAARTPGLKREPAAFVRHTSLGDFAVNYELNVYCDDAHAMNRLYTELHRNILDVFNEYGVQIMTPAYEGDPPEPKVVPREQWHMAPAIAVVPAKDG
jgi:small-conductance mechanosensitive channel